MEKMMTEKEVLDVLNIEDFRHMSKDKVIAAFSSMLPNMSPEIATKMIDQYQPFAQAMTEIASYYKEILFKSVDSTHLTTQQCIAAYQTIIDALCEEVKKNNLSFEEKRYYVEQMQQVGQLIKEINEEHNKTILKCVVYGLMSIVTVGCCLLTGFGGDIHLTMPQKLNGKKII